jgi:hypothetical protein
MSESCCRTTPEGNSYCVVSASEEKTTCGCSSQSTKVLPIASASAPAPTGIWQKIRAGMMFGLACITSPCCTPLIVPLGLALIAGTPLAAWLTQYIGWVYGGLTLVSIVSLVLGWRWLGQKVLPQRPPHLAASVEKPISEMVHE